jgi:hypothetical protein
MPRNRPDYETEKPDPFPGAYSVRGWRGVAFHVLGWEVKSTEDTEWTGIKERTGKVIAVMVGDDAYHKVDPDDLTRLKRSEYCGSCGQIGCGCDPGGDGDE